MKRTESIEELRRLCQGTRPSIFRDFLSKFYYRVSIYLTWACLKVGLTANQVTVLSGLISCLGGVMLSSNSPVVILIGCLMFHLFAILDMSDGEVARYHGVGGVGGHFLDWLMHFVSSVAVMLGLFYASATQLPKPFMFLGVLGILIPVLDKAITASTWTVVAWTRLRDLRDGSDGLCEESSFQKSSQPVPKPAWVRWAKFVVLSPLQDHWLPLILLLFSLVNVFIPLTYGSYDFRTALLIYVSCIGLPYLALRVRGIARSSALEEGYQRLFCARRRITLPEDDFIG